MSLFRVVMNDLHAVRPSPRHRLSVISQESDVRPTSPGARSLRSISSTSTLDSVGFDSAPPLPAVIYVRECSLRRKTVSAGWGFTLRGTRSEFGRNEWMYNCFVEAVSESGAAGVSDALFSHVFYRVTTLYVCLWCSMTNNAYLSPTDGRDKRRRPGNYMWLLHLQDVGTRHLCCGYSATLHGFVV